MHLRLRGVFHQPDSALLACHGMHQARIHQRLNVLVQGAPRAQAEGRTDLIERRPVIVSSVVVLQIVVDRLLAAGEGGAHGPTCRFSIRSL